MTSPTRRIGRIAGWASLVILGVLYLAHFQIVRSNAVNVPFWDEWDTFKSSELLSEEFPGKWIWASHNEHRLIFTKLQVWLLYRLNGWDHATHQTMNFLVFGLILISFLLLLRRADHSLPLWARCAFSLFLLSPVSHRIHTWGWASSFHFQYLFFTLAAILLFRRTSGIATRLTGALALVACMYSMSGGLVSAVVLLVMFLLGRRYISTTHLNNAVTARDRARRIAAAMIALLGILLWFVGYESYVGKRIPALPTEVDYWRFFVNLISLGFGFESVSVPLGVVCLALVLIPAAVLLLKRQKDISAGAWVYLAATGGLLASLASITLGRAGADPWHLFAKESKYVLGAALLVPLAAVGWSALLKDSRQLRVVALLGLWTLTFVGYADDWSTKPYESIRRTRTAGLNCVSKSYWTEKKRGKCPEVAKRPLRRYLIRAEELNLSFMDEVKKRNPNRKRREPEKSSGS